MTPLLLHDLLAALESVYQYGEDTLSGRADGGLDDRAWQRAAVIEMTRRARIALDGAKDFAGDERVGLFSTQRLLLHDLLYALVLLRTGRPDAARDLLERVIRENGGAVPTGPAIEFKTSAPQPKAPLWMRPGS